MRCANESPAPADATGLLNAGFVRRIRRTARLLGPACPTLEARFLKLLAERGFDPNQARTLAAITLAAAVRLIARGKPLPDFFEQVAYSGRRLAKLDVDPVSVLESLAAFDGLLLKTLRSFSPADSAEVRWVSGQLSFCTVITLNNAFYQVREAETAAFFELHDAELEAANGRDLIESYVDILARYARADAVSVRTPEAGGGPPDAVPTGLSKLRMFQAGASPRLLLDPDWSKRYRSVWSVPLGGGVVQFAFKKDYAWLPREVRLITGAAVRVRSVLEKLRLTGQLALREQEVRELATRMRDTEERERRRIRRELHDETAQILPYLCLHLEMLESAVPETPAEVKRGLAEARELIGRTIVEIRRILSDLSPAVLEQLGLAAAVRQLLKQLRQAHGIAVSLDSKRLGRLPRETETAAYRIIQECCTNVARHSSAAHLNVSLSTADGELKMRIEDDGVGFLVEEALTKKDSYGLAGMRERAALAGGRFDMSSRPGDGTLVAVTLPAPARLSARPVRNSRSRKTERHALIR